MINQVVKGSLKRLMTNNESFFTKDGRVVYSRQDKFSNDDVLYASAKDAIDQFETILKTHQY